jgi:hypothetical protein
MCDLFARVPSVSPAHVIVHQGKLRSRRDCVNINRP